MPWRTNEIPTRVGADMQLGLLSGHTQDLAMAWIAAVAVCSVCAYATAGALAANDIPE